jgi:hypothetical protein
MMIYRKLWLILPAILTIGLASGCRNGGAKVPAYTPSMSAAPTHVPYTEAATSYATTTPESWTCPMHSQVWRSKPGPCPICGMDLVRTRDVKPVERSSQSRSHSDSHSSGSRRSRTSGHGCCG